METNKYITPVMERVIKLQSQIKELEIENLEYRQKIQMAESENKALTQEIHNLHADIDTLKQTIQSQMETNIEFYNIITRKKQMKSSRFEEWLLDLDEDEQESWRGKMNIPFEEA